MAARTSLEHFRVTAATRVDLAGGTLDLWPIYPILGGGKTINLALDLTADVTFEITPSVSFRAEIKMGDNAPYEFDDILTEEQIAKAPAHAQFPARVVSYFLSQQETGVPEKFLKIEVKTKAPLRSGLGGSSTLCVALVRGLWEVFKYPLYDDWQWKLVDWAMDIEAAHLHVPTGTQDYFAPIFGGLSCYLSDVGGWKHQPFAAKTMEELNRRLLVLFSGEQHSSGLSNWDVFKRFVEKDKAVISGFVEIKNIAESLEGELKRNQIDWAKVGKLMSREWEVRRDTFKVNTPKLDEIISVIQKQKILGVKVCGAAAGGSLIVLADPSEHAAIRKTCEAHKIEVLKTTAFAEGVKIHPIK